MNNNASVNIFKRFISIFAILFSIFQLIVLYYPIFTMYLRVIHVWFAFSLIYFTHTIKGEKTKQQFSWDGVFAFLLITIISCYILSNYQQRAHMAGLPPPFLEIVLGVFLIILTIEASRRTIGWSFTIISIVILLYARFGSYLPFLLGHKSYSISRIVGSTFLTMWGVYGSLVGISASYIFLFVLFGSFLKEAGGGDFFINLALSITGRVRGGPAKTAVVASSLFGMVSGSGMANVAATGQITIPLMIKTGYKPYLAGAIETAASTGGLIAPPIMGMSIFIMMGILGIPYIRIIKSAIFIAILYYIGLFLVVDLEAVKSNLKGMSKEEIPNFRQTIKEGWPFLIPPLVLIYMLVIARTSIMRAAFWAVVSIPISTYLKSNLRMGVHKILKALENGAYNALPIISVVALAGIAMGMISLTGLGLRITSILIALSGENVFLLLFFAMIACIIMGMGLPAIAAYIITSALIAPALTLMGIDPFIAHMFIFYFSCFAGLTPPMAPFAFVAAGIAQSPPMRTAMMAWKIALPIFIIAYAFVYSPSLLLIGSTEKILLDLFLATISVVSIVFALVGCVFNQISFFNRLSFLFIGIFLLFPNIYVKSAALIFFIILFLLLFKIQNIKKP